MRTRGSTTVDRRDVRDSLTASSKQAGCPTPSLPSLTTTCQKSSYSRSSTTARTEPPKFPTYASLGLIRTHIEGAVTFLHAILRDQRHNSPYRKSLGRSTVRLLQVADRHRHDHARPATIAMRWYRPTVSGKNGRPLGSADDAPRKTRTTSALTTSQTAAPGCGRARGGTGRAIASGATIIPAEEGERPEDVHVGGGGDLAGKPSGVPGGCPNAGAVRKKPAAMSPAPANPTPNGPNVDPAPSERIRRSASANHAMSAPQTRKLRTWTQAAVARG